MSETEPNEDQETKNETKNRFSNQSTMYLQVSFVRGIFISSFFLVDFVELYLTDKNKTSLFKRTESYF